MINDRPVILGLTVALITLGVAAPALAQPALAQPALAQPALAQNDSAAEDRLAAANQLGILEYCRTQGYVDATALAAQEDAMVRLPASTVPTAAAEASGRAGILGAPGGQNAKLEELASMHGSNVAAICRQLGAAAIQADAKPNSPTGVSAPNAPK